MKKQTKNRPKGTPSRTSWTKNRPKSGLLSSICSDPSPTRDFGLWGGTRVRWGWSCVKTTLQYSKVVLLFNPNLAHFSSSHVANFTNHNNLNTKTDFSDQIRTNFLKKVRNRTVVRKNGPNWRDWIQWI